MSPSPIFPILILLGSTALAFLVLTLAFTVLSIPLTVSWRTGAALTSLPHPPAPLTQQVSWGSQGAEHESW